MRVILKCDLKHKTKQKTITFFRRKLSKLHKKDTILVGFHHRQKEDPSFPLAHATASENTEWRNGGGEAGGRVPPRDF